MHAHDLSEGFICWVSFACFRLQHVHSVFCPFKHHLYDQFNCNGALHVYACAQLREAPSWVLLSRCTGGVC
jgi:hypothetical protein